MSNYGWGEFVYKRTYSRIKPRKIKDNNGNVKIEYGDDFEEWHETIERVVNGVFKIKKNKACPFLCLATLFTDIA